MEKDQIIHLKEGQQSVVTLVGPATIIILKEEAAAGTTASDEQNLPLMKFGETKWGECRYPDENGN